MSKSVLPVGSSGEFTFVSILTSNQFKGVKSPYVNICVCVYVCGTKQHLSCPEGKPDLSREDARKAGGRYLTTSTASYGHLIITTTTTLPPDNSSSTTRGSDG